LAALNCSAREKGEIDRTAKRLCERGKERRKKQRRGEVGNPYLTTVGVNIVRKEGKVRLAKLI